MLKKAARDCQVLFAYLSRRKKQRDQTLADSESLAVADRIIKGERVGHEDLQKVYQLLQTLSATAFPATAESILDSNHAERLGLQRQTERSASLVGIYAIGIVAFILTFAFGLYVNFTDVIVSDYRQAVGELSKINRGNFDGTRLEAAWGKSALRDNADKASDLASSTPDPEPAGDGGKQTTASVRLTPITLAEDIRSAKEEISLENEARKRLVMITTLGLAGKPPKAGGTNPIQTGQSLLYIQGYINRIVTSFLLPICASIVGDLVFIQRDRSKQQESTSLVAHHTSRYWPRILVATIAGVIIGWFTGRDESGVLATLTPAAIAFIVGYSLEIFFNLLDSIKVALGVKETN